MARLDQLEIVGPDGNITFHDLDPAKGVTNIGRDPENEIVIDRPEVALFLAMIDHREKPYQIMILDESGRMLLDGQPLQSNLGRDLHEWSTVESRCQLCAQLQFSGKPSVAGSCDGGAPQ